MVNSSVVGGKLRVLSSALSILPKPTRKDPRPKARQADILVRMLLRY